MPTDHSLRNARSSSWPPHHRIVSRRVARKGDPDTSLKNLKDVRAYTKLTVLGSIPLLENDFVVRRRRRLGWLAWAASLLLGILLMAGSVVYYYTSRA